MKDKDAAAFMKELLTPAGVIDGWAIADPDGSVTDGPGGHPWGVGETEDAAWRAFGHPALKIDAYKADGWHAVRRKLRKKSA